MQNPQVADQPAEACNCRTLIVLMWKSNEILVGKYNSAKPDKTTQRTVRHLLSLHCVELMCVFALLSFGLLFVSLQSRLLASKFVLQKYP